MKIINILGAPGSGKSTLSHGLMFEMKRKGYNVEYVNEYAKDLVWEERFNMLLDQQEYIFAQQHKKISRLKNKVDYVVTDSPLLLFLYYGRNYGKEFKDFVKFVNNQYNNYYFYIERAHEYKSIGRTQTEKEANELNKDLLKILEEEKIELKHTYGSEEGIEFILKNIIF